MQDVLRSRLQAIAEELDARQQDSIGHWRSFVDDRVFTIASINVVHDGHSNTPGPVTGPGALFVRFT